MFKSISEAGWRFPNLDFHLVGTKLANLFGNKIPTTNFQYVSVFDGTELSWDCNKFPAGNSICRTVDTVSKRVLEMQCNPSMDPACKIKEVPDLLSRMATPI